MTRHAQDDSIIERVNTMSEEVRLLALNLAIYLAKAKQGSTELNRLEPDFMRLVNGTVKAVREIGHIINAARNAQDMAYDIPTGRIPNDHLELKLRSILDQCGKIMQSLSQSGDKLT